MVRREKVADRAGSLVTERVRGLIESAQGRAETVRRAAADEAHRLDSQRMQAASRIVSEIEDLESVLGELRRQMQSEHAVEGSYVDEDRLIEAAQEGEDDLPAGESESSASASATDQAEEPPAEVKESAAADEAASEAEEPVPDTASEPTGSRASEADDDAQRTRFSFRRRRERQEGPSGASADAEETEPEPEPEPDPDQQGQTYACAVCGRGFVGDEDELKSLGWVVSASGEVTCADCYSAGWLRPSG